MGGVGGGGGGGFGPLRSELHFFSKVLACCLLFVPSKRVCVSARGAFN